jgi:hypothetical protein
MQQWRESFPGDVQNKKELRDEEGGE